MPAPSPTVNVAETLTENYGSVIIVQQREPGVYDFMAAEITTSGVWRETRYFGRFSGNAAALTIGRLVMVCTHPMTVKVADAVLSGGSGFGEFVRTRIAPTEWQGASWDRLQRYVTVYTAR